MNKSYGHMEAWKAKSSSERTQDAAFKLIGVRSVKECGDWIRRIEVNHSFRVTPQRLIAFACWKLDQETCDDLAAVVWYNLNPKNFNQHEFEKAEATYFGGTKAVQKSESVLLDFRDAENDRLKAIIAALQQENTRLVVENHTLRGNQ